MRLPQEQVFELNPPQQIQELPIPQAELNTSNQIPPPAPLPSPEAFDGFPNVGDEELLGLPSSDSFLDLPSKKVQHKPP